MSLPRPFLRLRLVLDLIAAGLLLFGLAYWWLGNVAHEAAGTAMFALLVAHNVFNRRFYGAVRSAPVTLASVVNLAATLALAVAMLAIVVTSVMISEALAPLLPRVGGFTVRQLHTLAAYWALVLVCVHIGLRWPMLMAVARQTFRISGQSSMRTGILRAAVVAIAALGIWSASVLGLVGKLSMQMSLDWWNFEESVAGFFLHGLAIGGLIAAATYYAMKLLMKLIRSGRRCAGSVATGR